MVRVIAFFTQRTFKQQSLGSPPTPYDHSLHLFVSSLDTFFRNFRNCCLLAVGAKVYVSTFWEHSYKSPLAEHFNVGTAWV